MRQMKMHRIGANQQVDSTFSVLSHAINIPTAENKAASINPLSDFF
jgi:hypothetical protein